ncbi:MAG: DUF6320 domain-containing protein [bacterium]
MPYCSRCGVEVDEYTDFCPLCEAPIQRIDEHGEPHLPAYPQEDRERPEDRSERNRIRRMIALQIVTTVLATPLVVVLVTDLLFGRHVTWSGYVVATLAAVWAYTAIPLLAPRRPMLILALDLAVAAAYLVVLDLFSGALEWFVPLGLPLIGAVTVVAIAIWILSVRARRLGANLAGFIAVGIAGICVITETVVEAYLERSIFLDWSLIVAVAVLPIAAFMFYVHYVLSKRIDLKRHFHI